MEQIDEARSKLPIAAFREKITAAVNDYQVVLIAGETGCGKTTQVPTPGPPPTYDLPHQAGVMTRGVPWRVLVQVPQYILDDWWGKKERCRVLCTQPRRISATSGGYCQLATGRAPLLLTC